MKLTHSPPLITVIVPTFNYAHFVGDALDSVLSQTYGEWECIVVDDGSTDDTRDVIAEYSRRDPRISYLWQANRGLSAARNAALERADGEYIQFLDADDRLENAKLSVQAAYLDTDQQCDIVYGRARYFPSDPSEPPPITFDRFEAQLPKPSGSGRRLVEPMLRGNIMVVSAALVRQSAIRNVGLFNESLPALEDWEYWLRFALAGKRFALHDAPGTRALVRVHTTSMSRNSIRVLFADLQVRRSIEPLLSEPWQQSLNTKERGRVEGAIGVRIGLKASLAGGLKLLWFGALHARDPRYLAWAAGLPLARTGAGRSWLRRYRPTVLDDAQNAAPYSSRC